MGPPLRRTTNYALIAEIRDPCCTECWRFAAVDRPTTSYRSRATSLFSHYMLRNQTGARIFPYDLCLLNSYNPSRQAAHCDMLFRPRLGV